jgi:hypothetical protein
MLLPLQQCVGGLERVEEVLSTCGCPFLKLAVGWVLPVVSQAVSEVGAHDRVFLESQYLSSLMSAHLGRPVLGHQLDHLGAVDRVLPLLCHLA